MHRGGIDILREVVVTMTGCLGTNTSSTLFVELIEMGALDVTHVRNSDDYRIIGIEVLSIKLMVEGDNLRTTLVTVLLLHLQEIVFHHFLTTLRVVEDLLQVGNEFLQVVKLLMELIHTQTSQLCQAHIDDCLRLQLIKFEASLQVTLGICRGLTISNNVYHLVDIVDGDDQAFEDMGPLLSLTQIVLGATDGHIMTMLHEILDALLQVQQTGTTLHKCDIIDRERTLQGCHLEEFVEQHIGIGITLHIHDDTHTLTT